VDFRKSNIALTMINRLYGIERELKDASDEQRFIVRQKRACRSWPS
jgi:hypothetical protein